MSRTAWPPSEAALAAVVVAWLRDWRWEVYQEVETGLGVVDIVATQGPLVWAIECKTSLSLAVLDQAMGWVGRAHYVSVAVPRRRDGLSCAARRCLDRDGVGLLEVKEPCVWHGDGADGTAVKESIRPSLYRRLTRPLSKHLCEQQKTYAEAGRSDGKRWTPFLATCDALHRFVVENPGATLKDAVNNIKTHYSTPASARNSLVKLIRCNVVPGVRCEVDGKAVHLFPEQP